MKKPVSSIGAEMAELWDREQDEVVTADEKLLRKGVGRPLLEATMKRPAVALSGPERHGSGVTSALVRAAFPGLLPQGDACWYRFATNAASAHLSLGAAVAERQSNVDKGYVAFP